MLQGIIKFNINMLVNIESYVNRFEGPFVQLPRSFSLSIIDTSDKIFRNTSSILKRSVLRLQDASSNLSIL